MQKALMLLAVVLTGLATLTVPAVSKPTTIWGAICSSQPNIQSCCSNMLNSCRSGCDARNECFYFQPGHCPCYNSCAGNYNRCIAQDLRRPQTGVTGGSKAPPATR